MIDTKTQEIKAADDGTYSDMRDLGDELPESSPRFILLSYPMTLVSRSVCSYLPTTIQLAGLHRYEDGAELASCTQTITQLLETHLATALDRHGPIAKALSKITGYLLTQPVNSLLDDFPSHTSCCIICQRTAIPTNECLMQGRSN